MRRPSSINFEPAHGTFQATRGLGVDWARVGHARGERVSGEDRGEVRGDLAAGDLRAVSNAHVREAGEVVEAFGSVGLFVELRAP